jgi:hypothetical protein
MAITRDQDDPVFYFRRLDRLPPMPYIVSVICVFA